MNEPGRREEGNGEAMLAGGQAERQTGMRLAGATVAEGDDVVVGDDIFAAREFENEWFVERRNSGEVECVETLHRWKTGSADSALDHAPFTIDEFKLGKAQEEADMIETLAGGFGGELFILAQEGRQFELSQVMREQNLRRRRASGRSRCRHAALPETRIA